MVAARPIRIADGRAPACLLAADLGPPEGELVRLDLDIAEGRIAAIASAGAKPPLPGAEVHDQDGGQVWPCFVDVHTHLDKGHIWPRAENPDGTFDAAIRAVEADRLVHWNARDIRARFEFGLRCAWAHGTAAIRTHLDSEPPKHRIGWEVFQDLRAAWADRVLLQAVPLLAVDGMGGAFGEEIADLTAEAGGVLGCWTFMLSELDRLLDYTFTLAADRGLDLDFHVDETGDPEAMALRHIAEAALRSRFPGKVLCGHCCSLAVQAPAEAARTLDLVAEAGIAVVALPMCNLYLQDRAPGRTPRWRGVTLLHEMAARGIPVCLASDNCRDPFYGYGDHDVLEVFREATRIAHLDRPLGAWPAAVTRTPADIMGLPDAGVIQVGAPADLILFRARHYDELLSRPQHDRIVLRAGWRIDTTPPDHRELDHLFERGPFA